MASLLEQSQTRRLILTAEELRQLTGWPSQVIEDYLAAIETILSIADSLDDNNDETDDLTAGSGINSDRLTSRDIIFDEQIAQGVRLEDTEQQTPASGRESAEAESAPGIPARLNRLTVGEIQLRDINVSSAVVNTNTPAGATAYQLAIKDESGTVIGYVPLYGSAW